jgi:hypothetical protein
MNCCLILYDWPFVDDLQHLLLVQIVYNDKRLVTYCGWPNTMKTLIWMSLSLPGVIFRSSKNLLLVSVYFCRWCSSSAAAYSTGIYDWRQKLLRVCYCTEQTRLSVCMMGRIKQLWSQYVVFDQAKVI